jgi:hypothetical protein
MTYISLLPEFSRSEKPYFEPQNSLQAVDPVRQTPFVVEYLDLRFDVTFKTKCMGMNNNSLNL